MFCKLFYNCRQERQDRQQGAEDAQNKTRATGSSYSTDWSSNFLSQRSTSSSIGGRGCNIERQMTAGRRDRQTTSAREKRTLRASRGGTRKKGSPEGWRVEGMKCQAEDFLLRIYFYNCARKTRHTAASLAGAANFSCKLDFRTRHSVPVSSK